MILSKTPFRISFAGGGSDLPDAFRIANTSAGSFIKMPLGSSLDEVEREMITRTIEFTGGNKTRAAEILGVSSKTLYNKLEQYESDRER